MPAKAVIAVLVVILIVIAGVAAVVMLRGASYSIDVPVPPGYKEADATTFNAAQKDLRAGGTDADLDRLFVSEGGTGMVFVAHQTFYLAETPPGDPEEAARYYNENKQEILDEMNLGFEMAGGASGGMEIGRYETIRLGTGDTALRMTLAITIEQFSMKADMIMVVKGKTLFMIMVQGFGNEDFEETVGFLAQNINFNK
jgi:hypothetical protein